MFSSDSSEYQSYPLIFAILSIFLAFGLSKILEIIKVNLWYIDFPSIFGFYWILRKVFSKYLWNKKLFGIISLSHIPNLNGKWSGAIHSTFNQTEIPFSANIKQNWDNLVINLETSTSTSISKQCSLSINSPESMYLTYLYENSPKTGSPETMNIHHGANELRISNNFCHLEGDYFTGRGRMTTGYIVFEKQVE